MRERNFFWSAAAVVVLALTAACAAPSSEHELVLSPGVVNAAGVTLGAIYQDRGQEFAFGQGALIQKNNTLAVTTIEHLITTPKLRQMRAHVRGLSSAIELNLGDAWKPLQTGPDGENMMVQALTLDDSQKQEIAGLENKGQLTPLQVFPANTQSVTEVAVVVPEAKQWRLVFLKTQQYSSAQNILVMNPEQSNPLCTGTSGAAVLQVEGDTLTNKLVGVVIGGKPGESCSTEIRVLAVK